MAGLMADEARKAMFRLFEGEELLEKEIYYNILARDRVSKADDYSPEEAEFSRNKTVYVIGAGSLGNAVALLLTLEGIKNIVIIDDDEVETVNLNRQILFYNKVGQPKATALAENLRKINPKVNVQGVVGRLTPDFQYKNYKPDLVMDCVDSFKSRALIDAYAKKNHIPLISGGTSFDAGQVVVWKPGETVCLGHALNIEDQLKRIEEEERHSCARAPDPSVIVSNWIVGSMMVGELYSVFGNIPAISGKFRYNSNIKNRLSVVPESPCGCR